MSSLNFELLRPRFPGLAALGAFAEQYAHPDPASALVKLRAFAEQLVFYIYQRQKLPQPFNGNLNDLLSNHAFTAAVPRVVVTKLHSLRIQGNKAAHGDEVASDTALWMLREAFDVSCWFLLTFEGANLPSLPEFQKPPPPADLRQELDAVKRRSMKKLKAQERELEAQKGEIDRLVAELEAARAQAPTVAAGTPPPDLDALLAAGETAANALDFNEETTRRRLIEADLRSAGWHVGPEGQSTSEVGQEVSIYDSAGVKRRADYVLWGDNGRPLAVIEAKRAAKSPELGREQARLYAKDLEQAYGQRPVIFYTNGYELYIWNDVRLETPRRIFGFYSKESLEYLLFQRHEQLPLDGMGADPAIAGRMYQLEAIKRVAERFMDRHRRALLVQATGTGKTRVAIALCDLLVRARWVKRILFLCDRNELLRQAENAFKQFLPSEPRVRVRASTAADRTQRIYLATYPAMMEHFQRFDVGFFDLVIADESHRSIYNRYRELFQYFDALQVGLTATPVKFITRNTYRLFGCEDQDPTSRYTYEEAIAHVPPYLVPYRGISVTTHFLRQGIKYADLTEEQRRQLEESEDDATAIDYDAAEVDKQIFNKDTARTLLRNLMEKGIRDATATRIGKSILFARSHDHAVFLQQRFDELYPQYGGRFCRVIDHYDPRAEQLIDDFKDPKNPLTLAISVDMLDTGIDIPEVVNLVFARPVRSYVKFWQMIGRGTRLCPDLFGPGRDKTEFCIFDHWQNFTFFGEQYKEEEPPAQKGLLQQLFEARLELADTALKAPDLETFRRTVKLLLADIRDLPPNTIAVKEKYREVLLVSREEALEQYDPATRALLARDIAPLMQWRLLEGHEAAYACDLLFTKLASAKLKGSAAYADLQGILRNQLEQLRMNLSEVKARAETIARLKRPDFWAAATLDQLEAARLELRGIMHYRQTGGSRLPPRVIDVREDPKRIEVRALPALEGLELVAYRRRVEEVLHQLFDKSPILKKIKSAQPVTEAELEALNALVLAQDPDLDLRRLTTYFPQTAADLAAVLRSIIGLDAVRVHTEFTAFAQAHPELTSRQHQFLRMLEHHIAQHGAIEVARLYQTPFTTLHTDSIDGLFKPSEAEALLALIRTFNSPDTTSIEA